MCDKHIYNEDSMCDKHILVLDYMHYSEIWISKPE